MAGFTSAFARTPTTPTEASPSHRSACFFLPRPELATAGRSLTCSFRSSSRCKFAGESPDVGQDGLLIAGEGPVIGAVELDESRLPDVAGEMAARADADGTVIDHLELFGLRQVFDALRGAAARVVPFTTPLLYRVVRHTLMLGFLLAFWATPHMTAGHFLFAVMTTGYILVGTRLEERDLVAQFGASYEQYRRRVPMLVPGLRGGQLRRAAEPHRADALVGLHDPKRAEGARLTSAEPPIIVRAPLQ